MAARGGWGIGVVVVAALWAQQPEPPAGATVIRTTASEVVVDVVVRDKKGKLVRGLAAGDFVVTEDGVPQAITSLREYSQEGSVPPLPNRGGSKGGTDSSPDVSRDSRFVTLVFDRLGIDSRRLARQAAFDMLREELPPRTYFAVFQTDLHLRVVQPFTSDRARLRTGIERATGNAPTDYANAAVDLRLAKDGSAGSEGAAESASNTRGQNVDGAGMAAESMNRMVSDMLDFAENSAREQQGRSSVFGLWGIVREQHRLPGRKTLLYFSEGLQLPNALQNQFRNMVSAANRANVAIYAIDARGLSTANDSKLGQDMLNTNLANSQRLYRGNTTTGEPMSREQILQFDRAMDAIRANPQVALAELAESTGGFLMANTNDFRQPLRRLTEELGSHYELVYRPADASLDGRFRAIEVRVPRMEGKVQARSGYFALPTLGERHAVYPYEVPLLRALAGKPLPRGLDFRSAVLRYRPAAGGAYRSVIVFDMPMKGIAFRESEDKSTFRSHFSFLALVKDERGEVVDKISRDLPMDEPAAKLAGFQQGRAIFTKPLTLRPGRYTLESAVSDRVGERIAARRVSLFVPAHPAGSVALSGIALVRRTDQPPPSPEPDDPFVVPGNRVIPMLADAVPGGAGKALSLYFVVYPMAGAAERPRVTMEFLRDGARLGGGSPELPAALADGRIPYIANTPLDTFAAGQYEVRVTAEQAGTTDRQTIFVTIE